MATTKTGGSAHLPLDPRVADKLLDLLSTDNEFRRLFKKDPVAALAKVGHVPAKELLPRKGPPFTPPGPPATVPPVLGCMQVSRIATKAEVQASRDALRNYLTSAGTHTVVFCFEAGKVASSLRRK